MTSIEKRGNVEFLVSTKSIRSALNKIRREAIRSCWNFKEGKIKQDYYKRHFKTLREFEQKRQPWAQRSFLSVEATTRIRKIILTMNIFYKLIDTVLNLSIQHASFPSAIIFKISLLKDATDIIGENMKWYPFIDYLGEQKLKAIFVEKYLTPDTFTIASLFANRENLYRVVDENYDSILLENTFPPQHSLATSLATSSVAVTSTISTIPAISAIPDKPTTATTNVDEFSKESELLHFLEFDEIVNSSEHHKFHKSHKSHKSTASMNSTVPVTIPIVTSVVNSSEIKVNIYKTLLVFAAQNLYIRLINVNSSVEEVRSFCPQLYYSHLLDIESIYTVLVQNGYENHPTWKNDKLPYTIRLAKFNPRATINRKEYGYSDFLPHEMIQVNKRLTSLAPLSVLPIVLINIVASYCTLDFILSQDREMFYNRCPWNV